MQTIMKDTCGQFTFGEGCEFEIKRTISGRGLEKNPKPENGEEYVRAPGTDVPVKLVFDFSGMDVWKLLTGVVLDASSLTVKWQNKTRENAYVKDDPAATAANMEALANTTQTVKVAEFIETVRATSKKPVSIEKTLATKDPNTLTEGDIAAMKKMLAALESNG